MADETPSWVTKKDSAPSWVTSDKKNAASVAPTANSKKEYSAEDLIGRSFLGYPQEEAKAQQAYLGGAAKPILGLAQNIPYKPVQEYSAEKLKDIKKLTQSDPALAQAAGIGEFTTETALTAAPIGRAFKLTKGLSRYPRYLADIGVGAATTGLASGLMAGSTHPADILDEKKKAAEKGALAGGFFSGALPILGAGVKGLVGTTSQAMETFIKPWEERGYKFSTSQLRQEKPLPSPGATTKDAEINEKLATQDVSKLAGNETENIDEEWVNGVLNTQGKKIGEVFNRNLPIDTQAASLLKEVALLERRVSPAGQGGVAGTAENLLARWKVALVEQQRQQVLQQMQKIVQRQQQQAGRRGGEGPTGAPLWMHEDWHTLYDADHPNAPEWMKDMQASLDELGDKLGFRNPPKVWAGYTHRSGLFGMTTLNPVGPGHLIIRGDLPRTYAFDTGAHEFGHQAEAQAFIDAPPEVQNAIIAAHKREISQVPFGSKTIEQLRPITSRKYGEARFDAPSAKADENYFRNFSEWYAEQVSRWITQTKEPTNIVEKFFKNVSDGWKEIYSKITGHTPLAPEMKAWLDSRASNRIQQGGTDPLQQAIEAVSSVSKETPLSIPTENVVANIPGKELQILRSDLLSITRTASDGKDRFRAGELIQLIDTEIIGRYDPLLLKKLQDASAKYSVGKAMEAGIEQGWVTPNAKVDLKGLDGWMSTNVQGYGSAKTGHPLYELGKLGGKAQLVSRFTGTKYPPLNTVSGVLGRSKSALVNALGSIANPRLVQRNLSKFDRSKAQTAAAEAAILEAQRERSEKQNATYSR